MFKRNNININQIPYILIHDFDGITEKKCRSADNHNKKIYEKLIKKVRNAEKEVKNTGLHLSLEAPLPPHPSNVDRYLLWKKRNVKNHVIPQSESIVFLTEQGYKMNQHYEAYQAIDLAREVKSKLGIRDNNTVNINNFDDVYTKNDKNIFRRRSMYKMTKFVDNNYIDRLSSNYIDNNIDNNIDKNIINENFDNKEIDYPKNIAPSAPPPPLDNFENINSKNEKHNSLYPSISEN